MEKNVRDKEVKYAESEKATERRSALKDKLSQLTAEDSKVRTSDRDAVYCMRCLRCCSDLSFTILCSSKTNWRLLLVESMPKHARRTVRAR